MTTSSHRSHDQLIALNTARGLGRGTVCRLAICLERWVDGGGTDAALSRSLSVPASAFATVRPLIRDAASIADREREEARRHGATIVTRLDGDFPSALEHLDLPPPVLYVRGAVPEGAALAVVGSRRASAYGLEATRFFVSHLARAGVVVVSGLALGIDGAAHRATVDEGGRTVAVLACGIDRIYPSRHTRLSSAIVEKGALVTEFPVGCLPLPHQFPIRNRLIAALGGATLIVEATPKSGSLITARLALELGRDLFAVPGRIFDDGALGTNALIRDGAFPALHPVDLLRSLGMDEHGPSSATADAMPPLAPFASRIWRAMTPGNTMAAEDLATELEAQVSEILAALLELELAGWVERFPGPVFARRGAWR